MRKGITRDQERALWKKKKMMTFKKKSIAMLEDKAKI